MLAADLLTIQGQLQHPRRQRLLLLIRLWFQIHLPVLQVMLTQHVSWNM